MTKRTNGTAWGLVAGLAVVVIAGGSSASRQQSRPGRIVPAFAGPQASGEYNPDHWSPDRRYIARELDQTPNGILLGVIDARSGKQVVKRDQVDSFVWVPHRRHSLVVAGWFPGFLGNWQGGHRWRGLHRVRSPEHEGFTLDGVTADGR